MLHKSEVKYIQNLSHKKFRDETGHFIAEGPKIINEFLAEGSPAVHHLYATAAWFAQHRDLTKSLSAGQITEIDDAALARISALTTPHQVLGIFQQPPSVASLPLRDGLLLMLDTIQDPGNMGTIIRCCDWFGISQLICSESCADVFNVKVVQASMGSLARVGVIYTALDQFLVQHPDWPVYSAGLNGKAVQSLGKIKKGILLIGNEAKGIRPSLLTAIPHTAVTIPKKGRAESLNAAVAAAILLSHLT